MYVDGVEVYGADYPTQIWHDVMAYALRDVPYSSFPDPDANLMPAVEYIISPSLEQDDLLSHGGVGAPSCVWDGQIVPCPTTTLPPTTAPPTTAGSTTTSHATATTAPTATVSPTVPAYAGGGPVTTFVEPQSPTTPPSAPTTAPATTAAPTTGAPSAGTQVSPPTATPSGPSGQSGGYGLGPGQRGVGNRQNRGYGP